MSTTGNQTDYTSVCGGVTDDSPEQRQQASDSRSLDMQIAVCPCSTGLKVMSTQNLYAASHLETQMWGRLGGSVS